MALQWDFNQDFVGIVKDANGEICNLYTGNALAIIISETKQTYGLRWFASNEQHMKDMLADDRFKADIAGMSFIFKHDTLKYPKVKTLIKLLTGRTEITLAGPSTIVKRKIYKN